jgi:hypothetical protein
MRVKTLVILTSLVFVPLCVPARLQAQDSEQTPEKHEGTAPRAAAAKYRAHAEKDGVSIGAELLTKKEAADTFAARINGCCLVVEIAVYPKKDEPIDLFLADFTLIEVGSDKSVRPESATVVAARLENKKNSGAGVETTTVGGVGYESGTYIDPATGQPVHVHGVTTSDGVGVSARNGVPPGVADHDRELMEHELYEKGLPEAKVSIPVSGYLYFPIPKQTKNAKYRLEYAGGNEPLVTALP